MTGGERLEIQPEYYALARSLSAILIDDFALRERKRPVIAIAGESGTGKSITATCLAPELDAAGLSTAVLHQDDYFLRPPRANHAHRVRDLTSVGPQEVDLALLEAHVDAFRNVRNVASAPRANHATDSFDSRPLDFEKTAVLIVEGTYSMRLPSADVRIFLSATHDETRDRRRTRNRDIDAPVIDRILAIEHDLIAQQATLAQIVIDRDFKVRKQR